MTTSQESTVHRVAIVGATGQIGSRVARYLREAGHTVVSVVRALTDANRDAVEQLKAAGCIVEEVGALDNVDAMTTVFKKHSCDTVVVTIRATGPLLLSVEPAILAAAVNAQTVRRFVPDEWGVHTLGLDGGECVLFDAKREMQRKVRASGLDWTFVFTGGFAHYFLPTLKWGTPLNTFGDLAASFPSHHIDDIGAFVARVVVDPRTINRAVQADWNFCTQEGNLNLVKRLHPELADLPTVHTTTDEILRLRDTAPSVVTAAHGAEPDNERHGINYACFGLGRMACLENSETLSGSALFPDLSMKTVEEILSNREFVFP